MCYNYYSVLYCSIIPPPLESDKGLLLFHSSDYIKFIKDRDQTITSNDITDSNDEEYGIGVYMYRV